MAKYRPNKRRRKRFQRQTAPGAAPGVIAVHPQSPSPTITATTYAADQKTSVHVEIPDELPTLRAPGKVLWIDVRGLGDAQTLRRLGDQFNLHPLALEDVVNVHQQVKVEDYGEYLFVVARTVNDQVHDETLQISMFVGRDFVVTFQEGATDSLGAVRKRLEDRHSRVRKTGADFLAYTIVDVIIDGYFPLLERYGESLDDLEDLITDHPPHGVVHDVHQIRNDLRTLRRVTWQHRESINVLLRDSTELITDETRTFLRDCHDHTIQLVDLLEIYRETCNDLRDVYLAAVSNRMNEIVMVLTVMATIFIPLGFIAGVYGMNFNPQASPLNMPELNWFFGYPFALGLMLMVVLALLLFFRHRGWIGRSQQRGHEHQ